MGRLSSARAWLGQGQRQVLDLVLANHCALCQRSTALPLCPSCSRQVRQCQHPTPWDATQAALPVVSWGCYEGSLRQAIGRLKYDGQTDIARFLGTELGQLWLDQGRDRAASPRPIAIVPIPLHAAKLQQRGFNQADLLAQWFCRWTQLPLHSHGLIRVQATQAQHSLSPAARQRNLAQAFAVAPAQLTTLQRSTVWLLDDIFTTGATAQSAAQTLRRSGISVGGICVAARAIAWGQAEPATGSGER